MGYSFGGYYYLFLDGFLFSVLGNFCLELCYTLMGLMGCGLVYILIIDVTSSRAGNSPFK